MRIKDGFKLKNSMGNYVVISVGARRKDFKGLMKLNAVAAEIWENVAQGIANDKIAKKLMDKYEDLSFEKAIADIEKFETEMLSNGFFEE